MESLKKIECLQETENTYIITSFKINEDIKINCSNSCNDISTISDVKNPINFWESDRSANSDDTIHIIYRSADLNGSNLIGSGKSSTI